MDVVKISICGAGRRGKSLCEFVFSVMKDVEVVAIADICIERADELADMMLEKTGKRPNTYINYADMFKAEAQDAVYIASDWKTHKEITINAFRCNIAVALEVGGEFTEAEWKELIAAYEETKTPFMFMENCCFGKVELFATSLARNGVFGEIVYCHGAYMHDLRRLATHDGDGKGNFRLDKYCNDNCDAYPTHELGPIAKLLDINRGNRMVSLTSRSSKACGLSDYIRRTEDVSHFAEMQFLQGDIVETLITCENGELISIRYDTTLPCYYSREFNVRGTRGLYEEKLNLVLLDGWKDKYENQAELLENAKKDSESFYDKYLPDVWKNISEEALSSGHEGIDYLQFEAFFEALREGGDMPIDIYDAASWMSITYLSRKSMELGGASVEIPDFTNGGYKMRSRRDVVEMPEIE
ncbi:MAG: Gfo/Idh/MocA family oxidoreductase [Oscillospiraceae bacterium]|nr:Gfo/Idh/MocA family oxidoreductase [Oscillospiraceae bacterium]